MHLITLGIGVIDDEFAEPRAKKSKGEIENVNPLFKNFKGQCIVDSGVQVTETNDEVEGNRYHYNCICVTCMLFI